MREVLGLWLLSTAFIFGGISIIGFELELKDKIITGLGLEVFVTLIITGAYLLQG